MLTASAGGESEFLTDARGAKWSSDGKRVFYAGRVERADNLWAITVENGSERPMTDLVGRPGTLQHYCLTVDSQYLYFCWQEDLGDIWVMDVVTDESE